MNENTLRSLVAIQNNLLRMPRNNLVGAVRDFWDGTYPNVPLEIRDAKEMAANSTEAVVVIQGRADFMDVANVPVIGRFWLDDQSALQMELRYELRNANPAENAWTFSRSFPNLPYVWNYATAVAGDMDAAAVLATQKPFVDSLSLFDTYYVLTSVASENMEPGLNLVSQLRPQGALGVLQATVGQVEKMSVFGPLRIPLPTQTTPRLGLYERPWDRLDAPGIFLRAPLGMNFKLGPFEFKDGALQVYTPHDRAWQKSNTTFEPRHAYVGTLSIPSAEISVAVSIEMGWNNPHATVRADCEGISLGKLTQLAGLAGGHDLTRALPKELAQFVEKLKTIELTALGGVLSLGPNGLSVQEIQFTLGMPDLVWKIWGDHLQVRNIACRFRVITIDGASDLVVEIMGTVDLEGVPLRVTASNEDDFTIFVVLEEKQTIPLEKLLKKFAPKSFNPGALTVDDLLLTISSGQLGLSTRMASAANPWVVDVGKLRLTVQDVGLELDLVQGAAATGAFGGVVKIGDDYDLAMLCTLAGDVEFLGTFRDLRLSKLIGLLCDRDTPMPAGFDLAIDTLSVQVSKQGETFVFASAAALEKLGTLAFVAKRTGAGSGFAFGVALDGNTFAHLPGLGKLSSLEKFVQLQSLVLVVSSFDDANFAFPAMAAFNQPALASKNITLPGNSGVIAGFNMTAAWQIEGKSREETLLSKLLGLSGAMQVTIQIGNNPGNARLFVGQQGKIHGLPFDYKVGVVLTDGQPGFFLTGSLRVNIQGQPQTFDLTTVFVPSGAFLAANMSGSTSVDCGPFELSRLGLVIGVNWGGIPSLGLTASISVKNFQSTVAAFFDSTDPSKSLVAGSISDTNLNDIASALVGGKRIPSSVDDVLKRIGVKGTQEFTVPTEIGDKLDALEASAISGAFATEGKLTIPGDISGLVIAPLKKGSSWHLTDLSTMRHYGIEKQKENLRVSVAPQFYFAPQATAIGTSRFPQGYYVNAAIEVMGFDVSATIEISTSKGISVDAAMDPISIGKDKLFSIGAVTGDGGPRLSLSTFTRANHEVAAFRPPHFYIDGRMVLLGVTSAILASVTVRGVEFSLTGPLAPGADFDIDMRLGKSGFSASGTVEVAVGTIDLGPLGKISFDTKVECGIEIEIDSEVAYVEIEADFTVAGEDFNIPTFKVSASPNALKNVAKSVGDKVEAALRDGYKDADRWARAVASGAVEGVDDAEKVLRNVYGKGKAEAKEAYKDAKNATKGGVKTVKKTAKRAKKAINKVF